MSYRAHTVVWPKCLLTNVSMAEFLIQSQPLPTHAHKHNHATILIRVKHMILMLTCLHVFKCVQQLTDFWKVLNVHANEMVSQRQNFLEQFVMK